MKKIICLILSVALLLCICGCGGNNNNTSSESMIVEYQEIIVDEGENTITSSYSPTVSTDTVVENPSSDNQTIASQNDSSDTVSNEIIIDYDTVVEVDICDDVIRAYLDATDPKQQFTFLSEYSESILDYQNLQLRWKPDGSMVYKLYISENADFSAAHVTQVSGAYDNGYYVSEKTEAICVPGKTYYWKILGQYNDTARGGGKIYIKDTPVRWVKIDGVINVRDMGGWKTESGKTVNYEKIYRGGSLSEITESGIATLKALGLKTDIDVRSTASWDTHGAVEKTGLNYHFINTNYKYEEILSKNADTVKEVSRNYPAMFALLADESNYPIYLHCGAGTDRTGTTAFILNGLLGVSYEDLTRDYEITSFVTDDRWRGNGTGGTFMPDDLIHENVSNSEIDAKWGLMNKRFMESEYCTDGKLSTAIENYLLACGVKQEHIDAYKNIMLK